MSSRILQRLLASGEYDEFEDVIVAEGEFIESDHLHNPIRQVILGMTPFNLLVCERHIANYKQHPEVFYDTEFDAWLDGLQMCALWPLCLVRMEYSRVACELMVLVYKTTRYYELTNTRFNGNLDITWLMWKDRVQYLQEDPYGYIRGHFDEFDIPYPEYFIETVRNRSGQPANKRKSGNIAGDELLQKLVDVKAIETLEKQIAAQKQTDPETVVTKSGKIRRRRKRRLCRCAVV